MNNTLKLSAIPSPDPQASESAQQSSGVLAPLLYDSADMCHVLRCSMPTLHRLKAAGKLPKAHRLDGQLRFVVEEVRRWCEAGMPDRKTWEVMEAGRG